MSASDPLRTFGSWGTTAVVEPEVQFWLIGATLTGGGLIYALLSGRTFIQNKWFYRDKSPKHYWFMQLAGVAGFLLAIYKLIEIALRD